MYSLFENGDIPASYVSLPEGTAYKSPNCPNGSIRCSPEIRFTRITARDATVGRAGFVESEGHHQAIVLVTGILEPQTNREQKRVRSSLVGNHGSNPRESFILRG